MVKSNAPWSDCQEEDQLAKMIFAAKTWKENLQIK